MTQTVRHQETSSNAFGTGTWTSASFTPTASRRLIVVAHAVAGFSSALEGTDLTISNSGGGVSSWTSLVHSTSSPAWGFGVRIWVSVQSTTATSISISLLGGGFNVENYRLLVLEDDAYNGAGATATGDDADGDGALSITLGAAPATGSIVLAALCTVQNTGTGTASPASGWATVSGENVNRNDWWIFHAQTRTGSTSTSVSWDDVNNGGSGLGSAAVAVEILQIAASATLDQESFRFGNDDGSENAHTWAAAQDTNIFAAAGVTRLANIIVNATGTVGAKTFKLQVRKVGEPTWQDVPVQ